MDAEPTWLTSAASDLEREDSRYVSTEQVEPTLTAALRAKWEHATRFTREASSVTRSKVVASITGTQELTRRVVKLVSTSGASVATHIASTAHTSLRRPRPLLVLILLHICILTLVALNSGSGSGSRPGLTPAMAHSRPFDSNAERGSGACLADDGAAHVARLQDALSAAQDAMDQQSESHRTDRERWKESEGATSEALLRSDKALSEARVERDDAFAALQHVRSDLDRMKHERDEVERRLANVKKEAEENLQSARSELRHVKSELQETKRVALTMARKQGANSQVKEQVNRLAQIQLQEAQALLQQLQTELREARAGRAVAQKAILESETARKNERSGWRLRVEEAERKVARLTASRDADINDAAQRKQQREYAWPHRKPTAHAAAQELQEAQAKILHLETQLRRCEVPKSHRRHHGRAHGGGGSGRWRGGGNGLGLLPGDTCAFDWLRNMAWIGSA